MDGWRFDTPPSPPLPQQKILYETLIHVWAYFGHACIHNNYILLDDLIPILQMLAIVHNMISGKLKGAEIYTNGWPEFSAVVCRSDDVLFHQVLPLLVLYIYIQWEI